jgi:ELWxxDGT repeat protein
MQKTLLLVLLLLSSLGLHSQNLQLLKDIYPGQHQQRADIFWGITPIGDSIYLSMNSPTDAGEPWLTDGTIVGTKMLSCIAPNPMAASSFRQFGRQVYFIAGSVARSLWKTDGSVAGTEEVFQFPVSGSLYHYEIVGPILLLFAINGQSIEVWRSDGTTAGTQYVSAIAGSQSLQQFETVGGNVFFVVDGHLYVTDGTALGTHLVHDIRPNANDSIVYMAALGGKVWFSAYDDVHGREMWGSDGTVIGTQLLDDYVPGPASGVVDSSFVVATSDQFYFYCTDGGTSHGRELRHSDGTLQGTVVVDFTAGVAGSSFEPMVPCSTKVYFNAFPRNMLCVADPSGITPLVPISTTKLRDGIAAAAMGDSVFFVNHQNELWRSDGTVSGTQSIAPVGVSSINHLSTNGRAVFFDAYDAPFRRRLWKTDGSAAGTLPLLEIAPYGATSKPEDLARVGAYVVFSAEDSSHGRELWSTDGTPAGTVLLQDIVVGTGAPDLEDDIVWQDVRYYGIANTSNGAELWRTDGTPSGTYLLKSFATVLGDAPTGFYVMGSYLYFAADDDAYGPSLWRTDGSASGTILIQDFWNPPMPTMPTILGHLGNDLLVSVKTEYDEVELWRTNGVPNAAIHLRTFNGVIGTGLRNPVVFNNKLYFWGPNGSSQFKIWETDGTVSGTMLISNLATNPVVFTRIEGVLNGKLVLIGSDQVTGTEIWVTDGTASGITQLRDVMPGALGSSPVIYGFGYNRIFFGADDGISGFELWKSDGTANGTVQIADLIPGSEGLLIQKTILQDHKLYFAAWQLNLDRVVGETDGTAAGTFWHESSPGNVAKMASPSILSTPSGIVCTAYEPQQGGNLFRIDQGQMAAFADPTGDPQTFSAYEAIALGSGLVIAADHPVYGEELFFADSLPFIPTTQEAEGIAIAATLRAYPVPTSDHVVLQLQDSRDVMVGYRLCDIAGRLVAQGPVAHAQSVEIDLAGLSAGMYIVQVQCARGRAAIAKVIKQ